MRAEGTPAARFALEHAHYTEDLAFWETLADGVEGPVLDLGAAVGRVSLRLARAGHDVVAVDADPAMVAHLHEAAAAAGLQERVTTHCADIRDLALGRTFPLIVMPMNTLQVFLTRDDQLAALRAIRGHLAAGGTFAFDVVAADLDVLAREVGHVHESARYDDPSGVRLRHAARFDAVDQASGTVRFTLLIDEIDGARRTRHERPHTVHLYSASELWELLADAGLTVQAIYGDFDAGELSPDSERLIVRCGVDA